MKKLLTIIAILSSLSLFAKWEEITAEVYPDADEVVLDEIIDYEYFEDGTYTCHDEQWIKVLTEKGRRGASTVTISYNLRYGNGEIALVELISEDGSVTPIDIAATLTETTDNSSADKNIFDPMNKDLTCAIPGVKVGDIIHLIVNKKTIHSRYQNQWSELEVLEYTYPIVHTSISIKGPKTLPLKAKEVCNPLGNVSFEEEELDEEHILYKWEVSDSPQVFDEPDTPPLYTQIQHLRVSTAESWEELSKWYWDLSVPHLEKTTEEITNKVDEVGHDIAKLYKWVAQEIRYMGLTLEDTSPGYAPHDVDITFNNRYGVCRDKAGLLVAMLRIAGFNAFPVLINHGAKLNYRVPQPFFNHAIVAVDMDGEYILMDPTDESSRDLFPSYLSNSSFLVCRPEGETLKTTPTISAEANGLYISSKGSVEADGSILLENELKLLGINDNAFRGQLLRMKAQDRRKLFERIVRHVGAGAELMSMEISPEDLRDTDAELRFKLVSRIPEMVLKGETRDELTLPLLSKEIGVVNWLVEGKTALEKRRFPLQIAATSLVEEQLELDLGTHLGEPIKLPQGTEVVDGKLIAKHRFSLDKVEYSPEEYLELKAELEKKEAAEREMPVFAKNELKGADVHYLKNEIEVVRGEDPYSWTTTTTVEKEILTYDGKKKSSEIILSYNPSWQKIDLVYATVSNKNGVVSAVTEKEINLMDEEWVREAPRYPATKQLIINLPSVEIGSVISYKMVSTVKASPLPFYREFYLDVIEPTDELTISIDGVKRTIDKPKMIVREPMQPKASLWRDKFVVSSGAFEGADLRIEPYLYHEAGESVKEIRDWMAKNIRVAGPSLYEVKLSDQLTDPATVIKERYASHLDYIRTLASLLKGAGHDADIVFASMDKGDSLEQRVADSEYVNIAKFVYPLVEVYGMFIGLENEYTPIGTSDFDGSTFMRAANGTFGTVVAKDIKLIAARENRMTIQVAEDGGADFELEETRTGASVGGFRKKYAEMLPEDRSRHYLELVSTLAKGAKATSELKTDIESYPAMLAFSAHVDKFARVCEDAITIEVPEFSAPLFPLTGLMRLTPIGVGARPDTSVTIVEVEFPEGYDIIEHIPEGYDFRDPTGSGLWYRYIVESTKENGKLKVLLTRMILERKETKLGSEYFSLLKDWSRIGSSRANRTISVRRRNTVEQSSGK